MILELLLASALALAAAMPASAEEISCASYVGTTVQPTSFDTVALRLSKVPNIKGEYETEAQFDQSQKNALAGIPSTYIIGKTLDPTYITYDADIGAFQVGLYAFDNLGTKYDEVFGLGTPFYGKVKYDLPDTMDIVITQREAPIGHYVGGNAMGARLQVTKVLRTIKVIFEGAGDGSLFPATGPDYTIATVSVPTAEAKRLKPLLSGAVVVQPKWPFVAQGEYHWPADFDNPEDTTQRTIAVVADIKCGLLLNGQHKVLAAFAGR